MVSRGQGDGGVFNGGDTERRHVGVGVNKVGQ